MVNLPSHIAHENVQSPDGSVDVWRCAYALASQSPTQLQGFAEDKRGPTRR